MSNHRTERQRSIIKGHLNDMMMWFTKVNVQVTELYVHADVHNSVGDKAQIVRLEIMQKAMNNLRRRMVSLKKDLS